MRNISHWLIYTLLIASFASTPLRAQREVDADPALEHYQLGLKLYQRGDIDGAIAELNSSIAVRSDLPEAHNAIGLLLGKKGADVQAVLFHFRKAIELRPNYADAHHNLGLVLAQLGRIDECIAEFRGAISADPTDPRFYNSLALTLVERNVDEAIQLYQKAIELKPQFVEANFNLALAFRRKWGTEREVEQLKKVIALDPDHLIARNTLTRRYEELGQYDEVGRLAEGTLKTHPESAEAHYFAAKAMLKRGSVAEGLFHLQQAVRLAPDLSEAHYHLALILRKQGKRAEADVEFAKAEALREKQHRDIAASIQMSNAQLSFDRGDIDEAITALREVVTAQPEWPDAHWRLGFAQLRRGQLDSAAQSFRNALDLDPNYFEAHYYLGVIELGKKNLAAARVELERAVQLRTNSPEAHRALGDALAQAGLRARAEAEYRTALQLRPDDPATLAALAQSSPKRTDAASSLKHGKEKLDAGDLNGSLEEFGKAVALDPELPEARQFLGTALLSAGQLDAAVAELVEAVQLRPGYFEALYNLGLAHARKGSMDTAIANFELALKQRDTSAECHDSLGVALATKKDYESAVREFRRAVELKPDWGLAHFHLGSALRLAGDVESAKLAFSEAQRLDPKLAAR